MAVEASELNAQMKRLYNLLEEIKIKMYLAESYIINWNNYEKSIFIVLLGLANSIGNIFWYVSTYQNLETRQWLNTDFFSSRLLSCTLLVLSYVFILIFCFRYRQNKFYQIFMPYFIPMFFGMNMLYGGYTIGIYNPVTFSGLLGIILVGLVLYERKIIYSVVVPVIIIFISLAYLTTHKLLPYAPLFSDQLNQSIIYHNSFWVHSMVVLFLPICFTCILLLELLLWQWRKREQQFELSSKTDSLTCVFNRRFIHAELEQLIDEKYQYALVLLDLDHFKQINDSYGHDVGDRVLKRIAEVLQFNVRQDDVVGRYGGEEFILILKDKTIDQVLDIAERCRHHIEQEVIMLNPIERIKVSASFGIAMSNQQGTDNIIREADQALYYAKAQGRNQVQIYSNLQFGT